MNLVYFIQSGDRGPVKIGAASNVAKRLKTLQIGNPVPLSVMATVPGGWDLEQQLHSRFAQGRIAFEWFRRDTPGLMELVEHILRHGEMPAPPEPSEDGVSCEVCAWPAEMELRERGVRQCWRCLVDAAEAIIPPVEESAK